MGNLTVEQGLAYDVTLFFVFGHLVDIEPSQAAVKVALQHISDGLDELLATLWIHSFRCSDL